LVSKLDVIRDFGFASHFYYINKFIFQYVRFCKIELVLR
jgi:hypothetical protein